MPRQSTESRHAFILDELQTRRKVLVRDLSEAMEVSESTIRRDLRNLAAEQRLSLVHGGAELPPHDDFSFNAKSRRAVEAKRVIGRLAGELVQDGDQLFVDSGSTCLALVERLRTRLGLKVIANSTRVPEELRGSDVDCILIGGMFRSDRLDCVGPLAMSSLNQLRGYQCFVSADGLAMDFGPSASDMDSAHFNRLAIENAREVIVLADNTKFTSSSLYRIVEWSRIDRVVTDRMLPVQWQEFFFQQGIELITPVNELGEPIGDAHETTFSSNPQTAQGDAIAPAESPSP